MPCRDAWHATGPVGQALEVFDQWQYALSVLGHVGVSDDAARAAREDVAVGVFASDLQRPDQFVPPSPTAVGDFATSNLVGHIE